MGSYLHLPCPGRRAKGETACQDSTNFDKQQDTGARFGLLISTGGLWKGKRLIGEQWLQGHAGLDIQVVAGDAETKVSIAKVNTKGFPFGQKVGAQCNFSIPRELIARSVHLRSGGPGLYTRWPDVHARGDLGSQGPSRTTDAPRC
ncbi:MAG: hypothetical protein QGG09_09190, partial [Pirellulaceae bacterium]|nr:hypothetical protein [Pirellulaceae bacterium]